MSIFRKYPYTNFHEMNLNWILKEVKRLAEEWIEYNLKWEEFFIEFDEVQTELEDTKTSINALQRRVDNIQDEITAYITDYFNNLDVQPEINTKIDSLVANGTVGNIILEKLSPVVAAWLIANITQPTGVVIDSSLSIEGACADAKATGDLARANKAQLINNNFFDLFVNKAETAKTQNGITFSWIGGNCNIVGTATGTAFCSVISSVNSLPGNFQPLPGKDIAFRYVTFSGGTPKSSLRVTFYNNGASLGSTDVRGWAKVTVPSNADGVMIRINVDQGVTLNERTRLTAKTIGSIDAIAAMLGADNSLVSYLDGLPANTNLDNVKANSVAIDTGNSINSPSTGAGFVYTFGSRSLTQFWIRFNNGDTFYRNKQVNSDAWNNWIQLNQQEQIASGNPLAYMFSVGNSILHGSVFINGTLNHYAPYGAAPYSVIANALNVPRNNVNHTVISSTGILYDAGDGNFMDKILASNIADYDVVLTHFWTRDMDYPIGDLTDLPGSSTLIGAIKAIVDYIEAQNKNAQLVLLSVPPCSTVNYGEQVFTGLYPNGKSISELDVIMKELANQLHFIYVDWQDLNISYYYQDLTDGSNVHANNDNTYKIMGAYAAGRISSKITF